MDKTRLTQSFLCFVKDLALSIRRHSGLCWTNASLVLAQLTLVAGNHGWKCAPLSSSGWQSGRENESESRIMRNENDLCKSCSTQELTATVVASTGPVRDQASQPSLEGGEERPGPPPADDSTQQWTVVTTQQQEWLHITRIKMVMITVCNILPHCKKYLESLSHFSGSLAWLQAGLNHKARVHRMSDHGAALLVCTPHDARTHPHAHSTPVTIRTRTKDVATFLAKDHSSASQWLFLYSEIQTRIT